MKEWWRGGGGGLSGLWRLRDRVKQVGWQSEEMLSSPVQMMGGSFSDSNAAVYGQQEPSLSPSLSLFLSRPLSLNQSPGSTLLPWYRHVG